MFHWLLTHKQSVLATFWSSTDAMFVHTCRLQTSCQIRSFRPRLARTLPSYSNFTRATRYTCWSARSLPIAIDFVWSLSSAQQFLQTHEGSCVIILYNPIARPLYSASAFVVIPQCYTGPWCLGIALLKLLGKKPVHSTSDLATCFSCRLNMCAWEQTYKYASISCELNFDYWLLLEFRSNTGWIMNLNPKSAHKRVLVINNERSHILGALQFWSVRLRNSNGRLASTETLPPFQWL